MLVFPITPTEVCRLLLTCFKVPSSTRTSLDTLERKFFCLVILSCDMIYSHSYLSLTPGDVQWMTAGRGIAHAEMPIFDPDPAKAEPVEGMQLWIDLPQKDKYIEPEYQDRKAEE